MSKPKDEHAELINTTLTWDAEELADAAVSGNLGRVNAAALLLIDHAEFVRKGAGTPEETTLIHSVEFQLGEVRAVKLVPHEPIRVTRRHGVYIAKVPHKGGPPDADPLAMACEFTPEELAETLRERLRDLWLRASMPLDNHDRRIEQALRDTFTISFRDSDCLTFTKTGDDQ